MCYEREMLTGTYQFFIGGSIIINYNIFNINAQPHQWKNRSWMCTTIHKCKWSFQFDGAFNTPNSIVEVNMRFYRNLFFLFFVFISVCFFFLLIIENYLFHHFIKFVRTSIDKTVDVHNMHSDTWTWVWAFCWKCFLFVLFFISLYNEKCISLIKLRCVR